MQLKLARKSTRVTKQQKTASKAHKPRRSSKRTTKKAHASATPSKRFISCTTRHSNYIQTPEPSSIITNAVAPLARFTSPTIQHLAHFNTMTMYNNNKNKIIDNSPFANSITLLSTTLGINNKSHQSPCSAIQPYFTSAMQFSTITNEEAKMSDNNNLPASVATPQIQEEDKITRHHVSKRFCEAAVYNGLVHLAGQLADDLNGDVTQQTKDTLANIDKFLADAGSDKAHIMSVVIYLKDMADYQKMNAVWDAWVVEGKPPARTCVEAKLYDPQCLVEMTVYAVQKH